MSRYIDADALLEIMEERKRPEDGADASKERYRYIQWLADYHAIKDAPSIEIVRCKECKHAHMTYGGDCKYCDMWKDDDDSCIELYLDGDFYCSYGERK